MKSSSLMFQHTIKVVFLHLLFLTHKAFASPPNILFIVADDLGYHDVGYHGADIWTPNIDELASKGVVLENYYVQPICTPSRSQLMTGRYQIHTGLQHSVLFGCQPHCVPLDEVFLPEKLKDAGYATHMVGKWHLGFYKEDCLPRNRGFDSFYGYYCGKEDYYTKENQQSLKIGNQSITFAGLDFHDNKNPDFDANGTYSTYLYQKRATEIITSHDQSKPLFLYMPFQSVHFPLEAPQKYIDMYMHIKDNNRRLYSAMVTAMDDAVGEIIRVMQEQKMWENTVTIFTTDNGGQTLYGGNNWPLRGRKASLWEGGVRAVGIAHGAGIQGTPRVSKELVHISDWFPTLISVAGGNTTGTKPLDSYNVWDAIAQPNIMSPREELLHNIDPMFKRAYSDDPILKPYPNRHGVDTRHGHTALRHGHWKLFTGDPGYDSWDPVPTIYANTTFDASCLVSNGHHPGCLSKPTATEVVPSVRLYNIFDDPEERIDLSGIFPLIVDKMLERIAAYNRTAVPVQFPPDDPRCDPSLKGGVWEPWV